MKAELLDLPAAAYYADTIGAPSASLSNSLIRPLLEQSPRHAWLQHPRLNPNYRADEDPKFDLGKTAHSILLEGVHNVVTIEADDWRTKAAKEERDAARAAGKTPMLLRQFAGVEAMVLAAQQFIESSPLRGLLDRAVAERTIKWLDKSGVYCRARLDLFDCTLGQPLIVDYKTTGAEGPAAFARGITDHGNDTQAAFYPRAAAAIGATGARFLWLVQEVEPPHLCYFAEPTESLIELGNSKVNRALALWKRCLDSNEWPAYPESVHQIEAPVWALKQEEMERL